MHILAEQLGRHGEVDNCALRARAARAAVRPRRRDVRGTSKHAAILKSLLSGYFANTALLARDGMHYRTLKTKMTVRVHPSSVLAAEETTGCARLRRLRPAGWARWRRIFGRAAMWRRRWGDRGGRCPRGRALWGGVRID